MKLILKVKRLLSLILIETLTFSSVAYAEHVNIPAQYGTISREYKGASEKFVIHIQDAHTSYSAQENLARIITHLNREQDIDTIAIEGAVGKIDISEIMHFPDPVIKKKVGEYFLKNGYIDSAEFSLICHNIPELQLIGIEDGVEYRNNHNAYAKAQLHQAQMQHFLVQLTDRLNDLKQSRYSRMLLTVEKRTQQYRSGQLDLAAFVFFIMRTANDSFIDLDAYEHLQKFTEVLNFKNNNSIEAKLRLLTDQVGVVLSDEDKRSLKFQEMQFYLTHNHERFYNYIQSLTEASNIDTAEYADVLHYLRSYIQLKPIARPLHNR